MSNDSSSKEQQSSRSSTKDARATNARADPSPEVNAPNKKLDQRNKRKGGPHGTKQVYRQISLPPTDQPQKPQMNETTNSMVVFTAGEVHSDGDEKDSGREPETKKKKPTPTNSQNSECSAAALEQPRRE